LGVLILDRTRTGATRKPLSFSLDHVQVLVPPGRVDDAARFYGELVGLQRIDRPSTLGGVGAWFRAGSQELHISEHDQFVSAEKAHPAFALAPADLDSLAARLAAAGADVQWDERLPGARRFYTFDPAGNRVEFLTRTRAT
jgi:catechol 2,3-dioxygenase-like lactoylglutathione lyase family enzyme